MAVRSCLGLIINMVICAESLYIRSRNDAVVQDKNISTVLYIFKLYI